MQPDAVTNLGLQAFENISVSLTRLEKYLLRTDFQPMKRGVATPSGGSDTAGASPAIAIKQMSVGWSATAKPYLTGVDLVVGPTELVGVVGSVGSGKTLLVQSIIGELAPSSGTVEVAAQPAAVGYVPQSPMIVSGTVLENICFGRPVDHARVTAVLEASQFTADLDQLSNGVQSEIGERGTTLSGGQQQRLSIARALYADPDVLVMDDPLSAVDAKVCEAVFEQAVRSRRKATVMVLNQLHLLKHCDRILFLGHGKVIFHGTWDELKTCREFIEWSSLAAQGSENGVPAVPVPAAPGAGSGLEEVASAFPESCSTSLSTDDANATTEADPLPPPPPPPPPLLSPTSAAGGAGASSSQAATTEAQRQGSHHGVKTERVQTGRVSFAVVREFTRAMGSCYYYFTASTILMSYGLMAASDIILGRWVRESQEQPDGELSGPDDARFAALYGCSTLIMVIGVMLGSYQFCWGGERVSNAMHRQCIEQLMFAPFQWFLETPSGQIMSRFSSDMGTVNFDIILDHFPRVFQLHPTPHALWAVFYLVLSLISC